MPLDLTLDRQVKVALYHQIAEQIKTRICDGRLPAGTRLPTVRQLAVDADVTRLTVQNAYGELQSDGWAEATVGRGRFVPLNTPLVTIRKHVYNEGRRCLLTPHISRLLDNVNRPSTRRRWRPKLQRKFHGG